MTTKIKDCIDKNRNTSHEKIEVCRLCAEESLNYISIFQDKDNHILEKINRCLPINIFPDDKLPSNVCRRCSNYLNISYNLILTAIKADECLRKQLDHRQNDAVCTDKDTNKITKKYQIIKRDIIDEQQIYQNETQNITDEKNIQNDWKTERKDIDEINYEKKAVTLIECNETAASVDLATDTELDIIEMKYEDLMQFSIEKIDNSPDFVTNKTTNKDINKNTEKCQIIKRETMDEENAENYQDNTQEMTDEKIIQNDWKTEREDIDEINYEKRAVTLTECNETSVDLATDTEIDIVEMKYEDLMQSSIEQIDNSPNFVTNKTTEDCHSFLELKLVNQNGQTFYCNTCDIHFEEEQYFETHIKIIHEKRAVICTTCSTKFSSPYDLFLHKREKHNLFKKMQLKYVCTTCDKFFAHRLTWKNHNKKCSSLTGNCCKYCKAVFTTRAKLTLHLRNHKQKKILFCNFCNKKLATNQSLQNHERIHTGEKPFSCSICRKSFRYKQAKQLHVLQHHKNFVCNHCGKCFSNKTELHEHISVRHLPVEARKYQCEKKFTRKDHLTFHKRVHNGVRPYKCDVCEKKFTRKDHLTLHNKHIHIGVRPYKCDVCEKKFARKDHLTVHKRVHSGVRPYKCDVCEKTFARKDHLTVHKRIHNGLRPYKCDVCSSSFKHLNSMKQHQIRWHFKKNVKCKK